MFNKTAALFVLVACVTLASTTFARNARIVNGQHAQPNQFPWHVAINAIPVSGARQLCGGVLISANFVLTTAQCVQSPT